MADKIFDDYHGPSIKINGVCYKWIGETTASKNAEPSDIGGFYDSCLECNLESSSSSSEGPPAQRSVRLGPSQTGWGGYLGYSGGIISPYDEPDDLSGQQVAYSIWLKVDGGVGYVMSEFDSSSNFVNGIYGAGNGWGPRWAWPGNLDSGIGGIADNLPGNWKHVFCGFLPDQPPDVDNNARKVYLWEDGVRKTRPAHQYFGDDQPEAANSYLGNWGGKVIACCFGVWKFATQLTLSEMDDMASYLRNSGDAFLYEDMVSDGGSDLHLTDLVHFYNLNEYSDGSTAVTREDKVGNKDYIAYEGGGSIEGYPVSSTDFPSS